MQVSRLLPFVLGFIPLVSAQNWSSWKPDAVFPGIEVRERCAGFNEFANRTIWDVELRNGYQKNIDFSWDAEPARLHGADTQSEHALSVRPGEVVEAHHTAPQACAAGIAIRVNEVRPANAPASASAGAPPPPPPPVAAYRPVIEGRWSSKDPEPWRKELHVQLSGKTVTSTFSSPNFSFQISTPLPERVTGSVSIEPVDPNAPVR
jgi:hypothetical protein